MPSNEWEGTINPRVDQDMDDKMMAILLPSSIRRIRLHSILLVIHYPRVKNQVTTVTTDLSKTIVKPLAPDHGRLFGLVVICEFYNNFSNVWPRE